jgi:hypothetical protein
MWASLSLLKAHRILRDHLPESGYRSNKWHVFGKKREATGSKLDQITSDSEQLEQVLRGF